MSTPLCDDFLAGLNAVLNGATKPVALHEPEFAGCEWELVKDCLDTGWVSSVGKYVDEFENRLAAYTGAHHAVSVVNGTAALHAALLCAGVGRDDEVLLPSLTFIATANAVSYCGAIPHFVDSVADNLGLDPQALEARLADVAEPLSGGGYRNRQTGRRLAAVVPMHVFGHPVDMAALLEVCGRYGLPVVEDAAESLGSRIGGRHTGTFGLVGTLSFNGNKTITTGGGGAILTDDAEMGKRLKHLTTTARVKHQWEFIHDQIGFNYRMPNLNAALGCAQMERLPEMLARKRRLAAAYLAAFDGKSGFRAVREPAGCEGNYWLNAVVLTEPDRTVRDACLQAAADAGYQCRPLWRLMHRLPMYEACPRGALPVAERLEASLINIPSSAKLGGGA
ncbi:DegT/DnrJ/EryC1/StrS aminotransferase family protein [uncultured Alphaproteobacteria bacterium]|uniref:GDP-perosamine synthase n=1 Tax=uncultured Alphaproteobacteria bacterium TaxID=91750 RepID=A0A212KDC6_9PROT|nr:DegT/DnrJ/EryC1/StrS aminotransferase family protein [uncultured Alphaproteobacteria bacterium]